MLKIIRVLPVVFDLSKCVSIMRFQVRIGKELHLVLQPSFQFDDFHVCNCTGLGRSGKVGGQAEKMLKHQVVRYPLDLSKVALIINRLPGIEDKLVKNNIKSGLRGFKGPVADQPGSTLGMQ